MPSVTALLTARRGRAKADWTDWLTYGYLLLGLVRAGRRVEFPDGQRRRHFVTP